MKKRAIKETKKLIILLIAGISYYLIFKYTNFGIPCIFYKITGFLCPACGISRMLTACLSGDFCSAYGYNKLLFITLPMIIFVLFAEEMRYIKTGNRKLLKSSKIFIYIEIVLLIAFGIARNIL